MKNIGSRHTSLGKDAWRDFERGIEKEWLLTNGIGGYASSTIIGANTRRYHGLLVASLKPPVSRHLVLAKIDESVQVDLTKQYNLYSSKTSNFTIDGYKNQQSFCLDPLPTYTYSIEDIIIHKKITMVYGENTTAIVYKVINGNQPIKLKLAPLINFRDYHHNSFKYHMDFKTQIIEKGVVISPYNSNAKVYLTCDLGDFISKEDCWFMDMVYPIEQERGLEAREDHFIPGIFEIEINSGQEKNITIIAQIETNNNSDKSNNKDRRHYDGLYLFDKEKERIGKLFNKAKLNNKLDLEDEFVKKLIIAADQFIVDRKSTNSKTIIAGYPWFTDWGRDTMIALPGITLVTGRFDDAKDILGAFAKYVKDGIIPNMFPDDGQEPAYNTVDASLWYFEAVNKYIEYTGDFEFIEKEIYPALKEILSYYTKGTSFNIKMDFDYLLNSGDPNTQLTWMDAMVEGRAVTPRYGKAVEINALWYNAHEIMSELSDKFNDKGKYYRDTAENIKVNFEKTFWNQEEQCLYDVVNKEYKDDKVRPNQILSVSLSNAVIDCEKAKKVVQKVWQDLYTAYGIRSLSKKSSHYKGVYLGNSFERDSAYHQGTAWSWLTGQFITSLVKAYDGSEQAKEKARLLLAPFKNHINEGCLGSISEIFDGDDTGISRGCFAQAWSVGEVLRAYSEIERC